MHYKNLCKRLLSKLLTQQLNPQIKKKTKEKKNFFFYFIAKHAKKGKNITRSKPRELKEHFWLKNADRK
jgi:hypothetical protein